MSKRPSDHECNQKLTEAGIPANATQKENTDQLMEMAAEQIAGLFWKCWMVSNGMGSKNKKTRQIKYSTGQHE